MRKKKLAVRYLLPIMTSSAEVIGVGTINLYISSVDGWINNGA